MMCGCWRMPLHHVAGFGIVIRSAYAEGGVRLLEEFDPETFAAALRDVTIASVVPTMLIRALDADPGPYSDLKAVLVGGGPIPDGLLERAHHAGIPALPTYGMTETCGQVATLKPGSPVAKKAHPLPGVELRIRDDQRILVRGPMISSRFIDQEGWLVTGDLGELDDEGALMVSGRADDMIITGGENVSRSLVQTAVEALPGVEQAVVVALPSNEWGNETCVAYTGSAEPDSLQSAELPPYAKPKRVRRVGQIPTTPLGKPDTTAIRDLFEV